MGLMAGTASSTGTYARIYKVVRRIPKGRVATYGQVAALAGLGGHARQVGYALSALPDDDSKLESVPWHRVINARGEVSPRAETGCEPGDDLVQRRVLEAEGVQFGTGGRVSLQRYRWRPRGS
jgi:methylated-DNA-protein-cysteine methyltransferase-like protein